MGNFFYELLFFVCQNMEKVHSFLRRWGSFSCEPPNLQLKQLRNFANQLSEQELNQLVQQRHSWLSASLRRRTNNKLVCIKLSRLVMPSGNFQLERIFSDLATIKFSTSYHCKTVLASKVTFYFGEQNLYMGVLPNSFLKWSPAYGILLFQKR